MKRVYLALAVLGLVAPYWFFVPFVLEHGLDLPLLVQQLFASPGSSFFATDVIVSTLVLWAFVFHETRKRRVPHAWTAVAASLAVGVSLGLPLFLFLRERALAQGSRRNV
jgi:hypothetical protein